MKKLLSVLAIVGIVSSSTVSTVACGRKTFGTDLSKLSDYNWTKEEPYFKNYDGISTIDAPEEFKNLGKIDVLNKAEFFDLSKNNTGFKTENEIAKQATTGVPLNSKFLPNGGRLSDVQLIQKKDYYQRINKLVDWKFDQDLDAKYNKSRIELQDSEKLKNNWVDTQDKNVKEMNMSTIVESTSNENTIIGQNRTYERSFNNYQYNDVLVSWAGAIDEGIIVPPAKNQVEKAHINGTKILGNIFLDGYHGLTKENVSGFLEKDNSGNYLVVDVLINMAINLGFDGWFWNNEPNGSNPNGFVMDYTISIEIMKQLKEKIKKSRDSKIQNLFVIGYKNYGSLSVDKNGIASDKEVEQIYNNTNQFLNDFYVFPNEVKSFVDAKNLNETEKFEIYNMFNSGGWVGGKIWIDSNKIGTRDFRDLTHLLLDENDQPFDSTNPKSMEKLVNNYKNGKIKYKNKGSEHGGAQNSMALFAGHVPYDIATQEMDSISKEKSMDLDTYGIVAANNYDDILYTGKKKSLSNNDIGLSYFPSSKFDEEIKNNPEKYSSGVGNIVSEKTTLIDKNKNFITNFSTGQGNRFASYSNSSKYEVVKNYPWSNTNIADVQQTYKWMINQGEEQISAFDKISGYYDYYDPYLKGNSIALGSGYDNKGQIQEATWKKDENYDWTIMGSNYLTNDNKEIEIIFKAPQEVAKTVQLSLKDQNNTKITTTSTPTKLENGWFSIKQDVANSVSKIGINFKATQEKFKINVGQISVVKKESQNSVKKETKTDQTKIQSELEIARWNLKNLRLNFENLIDENIYSYYEIYKKNTNNKLTMIGMSNSDNYFIKNINQNTNEFYLKATNNLTKKIEWIKFEI
ncbi:endo-beta-N-acetylglucosaminidase [Spiroplasma endosymbiont of Atherix ibis]|uniref:endo-beta-N-acetylglucosaminidase n=1 Tax=Spiroplasma endosymbiont of Atherix ibis TaxID=3066291 RepID=UPI0030D35091